MGNRSIGRLILIKNSIVLAEVFNNIDNYINTFDGTRFVGEIGTYVSIYELGRTLIAEVLSAESSQHASNAPLAKPNASRIISLRLIGEITNNEFFFGVSKMPLLYSEVHIVTNEELNVMLDVSNSEITVSDSNTRVSKFSLGKSVLFSEYDVKVDLDKFFGYHSAIFGNTGAGKSNSIARIIQNIFLKSNYSALGSRLILIDSNGEYKKSFSEIEKINNDIKCQFIKPLSDQDNFEVPIWLLSVDDWAILLNASEKTQIPVLRKTMEVVKIFYSENDSSEEAKNHILASTITGILNSSESSPSKSDKVSSLLTNFPTKSIKLETKINSKKNLRDSLNVNYGKIDDIENIISFLQKYINFSLMEEIKYNQLVHFSPNDFLTAMKFAILYEGSLNSQRVQEYTAPLVSRMQSLVESPFSKIFNKTRFKNKESFFEELLDNSNILNIDISAMDDSMSEVLIRVLAKIILDYQKGHQKKADKPINLFIEEAHRYIKDNGLSHGTYDFDIFQRISKEGRKYGFLICVSTQRPSDLSKTVVSQCSNFIVHRIQNPDDLNYISRMVPYIDRDTIDRLTYLQTGHALVFGSAIKIPMLTSFAEAIPNTDGNSAKISEKWYLEK
ncbi:ATP-binding protein [Enterococcus casseliflavus]|uniref:ATP-binding protein n=1 Tax=Enterococcus casseliflavus TaxID=37734 RepID=UPI0039A4E930